MEEYTNFIFFYLHDRSLYSGAFWTFNGPPAAVSISISIMAVVRSKVISLYKMMMTESNKFPSYNYR